MSLEQNKQVVLDSFRVLKTGDGWRRIELSRRISSIGRRMTISIDLIEGSQAPQA